MDTNAVFVTVYEKKGIIMPGFTRERSRHSSIVVGRGDTYDIFHLRGTPGIGLTFHHEAGWKDPRTENASLLAMDLVEDIPVGRFSDIKAIIMRVPIQLNRDWNCQNWVREGLDAMVAEGLITDEQRDSAVKRQMDAISKEFAGESPNFQAL
jgi:hypothetical protein